MSSHRRTEEGPCLGRCGLCSTTVFEGGIKLTSVEGDWVAFHADCALRAAEELQFYADRGKTHELLAAE